MIDNETLILASVNKSNDLIILDYNLSLIRRIEGIAGPPFSQSMSSTSITGVGMKRPLANWLKGNHQSALIDAESGEEIDRAPLFGSVNTYSSCIPILSAYCYPMWVGVAYSSNQYVITVYSQGKTIHSSPISSIIPEAKIAYSLHISNNSKYIIALVGSTEDLPSSTVFLLTLSIDHPFRLVDYRRIHSISPDHLPTLYKDYQSLLFVLNTGHGINMYRLDNDMGLLEDVGEINDISEGSLVL